MLQTIDEEKSYHQSLGYSVKVINPSSKSFRFKSEIKPQLGEPLSDSGHSQGRSHFQVFSVDGCFRSIDDDTL